MGKVEEQALTWFRVGDADMLKVGLGHTGSQFLETVSSGMGAWCALGTAMNTIPIPARRRQNLMTPPLRPTQ